MCIYKGSSPRCTVYTCTLSHSHVGPCSHQELSDRRVFTPAPSPLHTWALFTRFLVHSPVHTCLFTDGRAPPPKERVWGTAAACVAAIPHADILRVHDVAEMRQVVVVADAILRRGRGGRRDSL